MTRGRRLLLVARLGAVLLAMRPAASVARPAAPAPAVTVVPVAVRDVAPERRFIGHVIAIQAVQVVPRVTAFIDDVPVKQGSEVKAGQVIYRLQTAQYAAALHAAEAQLASAKAALWQAQLAYQRTARLIQQNFETQADLDQAQAARDQDQGNVEAAQANLEQAQLNLGYCTIRSPIDGRIGAVTLTKGNLVTPATPPLATVNQLDPIRVAFAVSDKDIVSAQQKTGKGQRAIAAGLVVSLELPDGAAYGATGKIAFLGNHVDTPTGTVSVYADFANPQALLLPGAYVTVKVRAATPRRRPVVPVAAVQTDQHGSYVLVVGADSKVRQQPIELGRQIAQQFIVDKGLSGGERVIVAGIQKVHPGEVVQGAAAPAPAAEPGGATGSGGRGQGG